MTVSVHPTASEGYALASEEYERARPAYPDQALDVLHGELGLGPSSAVLELGAGTGKLSRMLRRRVGLLVTTEPVASMRAQLAAAMDLTVVAAVAEAVPLVGHCVDAVVVGTAFHWFRADAALAEARRVLRQGGGLGLVWNNPDRACDWVAQIWAVVDEHRGSTPGNRDLRWQHAFRTTPGFTPLAHRRLRHRVRVTPDDLVSRVASISFIASLAPGEREGVLALVRRITADHPDLAGHDRFDLPYRTDVYWCHAL